MSSSAISGKSTTSWLTRTSVSATASTLAAGWSCNAPRVAATRVRAISARASGRFSGGRSTRDIAQELRRGAALAEDDGGAEHRVFADADQQFAGAADLALHQEAGASPSGRSLTAAFQHGGGGAHLLGVAQVEHQAAVGAWIGPVGAAALQHHREAELTAA